ncbi:MULTISPECIES: hypothetical protein [Hymenobacter]|uniref:Uncharacterized protein n=1 Tax=Hymenobacter jejuensis TaxID=2502781 RepID=A0A5B8A0R1_9BACT|nr:MULTISPECIES: hypothetical protein [Hymenobacter]MBC6990912.1 hypothetical protein [Hymenobacter sp. BT491]QDA60687.1 hypothetical protein FHG12_11495 [Hymenobacter jejuensis]
MATPPYSRNRGILYLAAGLLLLIVQGLRIPQYYTDWETGALDTPRFVLSLVFIVFALYMLRAGWQMLRHKDDLID